jgi:hypothetical protein
MKDISKVKLSFDNHITFLYKFANLLDVKYPNYLIIIKNTHENNQIGNVLDGISYESLTNFISRNEISGLQPNEIFEEIQKYNKCIDKFDLLVYYYSRYLGENKDVSNTEKLNFISNMSLEIDPTTEKTDYGGYVAANTLLFNRQVKQNEYQQNDEKVLQSIVAIQTKMIEHSTTENITIGELTTATSSFLYNPTINGKKVKSKDGLDIFNSSIPSQYVLYIGYIDNNLKLYSKIYNKDNKNTTSQISNIIPEFKEKQKRNTIYMKVWAGDIDYDDFSSSPDNLFHTIIYELDENKFNVKIPGSDDLTLENIKSSLPVLELGSSSPINFKGFVDIQNFEYQESIFLDLILNDPVLSSYIRIKDNNHKPLLNKKLENLTFNSLLSNHRKYWGTSSEVFSNSNINVDVSISQKYESLPNGNTIPFISLEIDKVKDKNDIKKFIRRFVVLLNYYSSVESETLNYYKKYSPETLEIRNIFNVAKATKLKVKSGGKTNLQKLINRAPEIFPRRTYGNTCQKDKLIDKRPIIIDDKSKWSNRQIIDLEYEGETLSFVCPNDTYKYPHYIDNPDIEYRKEYPCSVCCNKKDQSIANKAKNCSKNSGQKIGAIKIKDQIKADRKFLDPEQRGSIPDSISKLLGLYREKSMNFIRFGVIKSPLSILHSISIAVSDPEYHKLSNTEEREEYVTRIRDYIINNTDPSLYKQELYDLSESQITDILHDSEFFDPYVFYRGIEEAYNINIFVFGILAKNNSGFLEIPRHDLFHSRPQRPGRLTVLIYKTIGNVSEMSEFPQCELILEFDGNDRAAKIFGAKMYEFCQDEILQSSTRTLTWNIENEGSGLYPIQGYNNIYYYIDQIAILKGNVIGQYIDNYGKSRGLNIKFENLDLTVFTLPSQPENIISVDLSNKNNIFFADYDSVVELFGEPSSYSYSNNRITGLWYSIIGIKKGEYIPIKPHAMTALLESKPFDIGFPVSVESLNFTERNRLLKRTSDIIVQVMRWLFSIWVKNFDNFEILKFIKDYVTYDSFDGDSLTYYNINGISRTFPIVKNIDEALTWLHGTDSKLSNGISLVVYNKDFYDKLISSLYLYVNTLNYRIIPLYISNYYVDSKDFDKMDNVEIFTTDEQLKNWINFINTTNTPQYFTIHTEININWGVLEHPYFLQELEGLYIIQNSQNIKNIKHGALKYALDIAQEWNDFKVNYRGYARLLNYTPTYKLYGLDENNKLEIITEPDNENFLEILYYGSRAEYNSNIDSGQYAAMLKLV